MQGARPRGEKPAGDLSQGNVADPLRNAFGPTGPVSGQTWAKQINGIVMDGIEELLAPLVGDDRIGPVHVCLYLAVLQHGELHPLAAPFISGGRS
jgi:hypothetical protein